MGRLRRTFARNVRVLRAKRGLTQDELAYRAGRSRNHIGNIEAERSAPSLDVIGELADALDVSPSALLEQTEWTQEELAHAKRFHALTAKKRSRD